MLFRSNGPFMCEGIHFNKATIEVLAVAVVSLVSNFLEGIVLTAIGMVILKMIVGHVNMMKNTTLQQNNPVYPEILLLLVTIVDNLTNHLTCALSADLMQSAIEPMQLSIMIILFQKQVALYAQFL